MSRLEGVRAVVTGSGRGIGRAIALAFAAEGAAVVVSARTQLEIEQVAREIEAKGGRAVAIRCDVASDADVAQLEELACEQLGGPVNVLVNNAGLYLVDRFLDYAMDDWQRVLDVNVLGTVRATRAFLPKMLDQGWGRVINIASTAGKWGSMYQSAYNVSKHGVVGLTRCLALELAEKGVRVNAICPGFVATDMVDFERIAEVFGMPVADVPDMIVGRVPIGRLVRAEEVAELALYLASAEADAMTGQALTLAGGMILI